MLWCRPLAQPLLSSPTWNPPYTMVSYKHTHHLHDYLYVPTITWCQHSLYRKFNIEKYQCNIHVHKSPNSRNTRFDRKVSHTLSSLHSKTKTKISIWIHSHKQIQHIEFLLHTFTHHQVWQPISLNVISITSNNNLTAVKSLRLLSNYGKKSYTNVTSWFYL